MQDALAESYTHLTPYHYVYNNPLRFIDPDGNDGWDIAAGILRGAVDNLAGTNLRSTYTPTDASDYNNALKSTDATMVAMGDAMVKGGTGAAATGTAVAVAGGVVSLTGVGAVAGAPTAAVGGAVAATGAGVAVVGGVMEMNAAKNQSKGYNYGKKNTTKTYSTRKQAKDGRPKPKPAQKGKKQVTHQSKNQSGEGNKMKTDGGSQTPHFHDANHNNKNKTNVHYRTTKKIKP